jgi:hypothetical protein
LLDAVAAGAINPDGDGGASLSDVQGFRRGGSIGPYNPDPRATYDNNSFLLDGQASTRIVPEQIANITSGEEIEKTVKARMAELMRKETEKRGQKRETIFGMLGEQQQQQADDLKILQADDVASSNNRRRKTQDDLSRLQASMNRQIGSYDREPYLGPLDPTASIAQYSLPDTQDDATVREYYNSLDNKVSEERRLSELEVGPDDGPDPEGALNEEFRRDESFPITEAQAQALSPEAQAQAQALSPEAQAGEPKVSVPISDADAAQFATDDPFFAAEIAAQDLDEATTGRASQQGLITSALDGLLNKRKGNEDSPAETSSAAVTKSLEEYSKEFAAAMPAYEGMSDSEKGYAIMEAGLRIMAGKSSNALTNIAEGLKGLGPKFAKDAKEKRAWNRQVDLSAAKYGLENVARDTAEIKADVRAGRKLYNNVFTVKEGKNFDYNGKINGPGSTIILKVSDVRDGAVDLSNLQTEKRDLAVIKAKTAATKARLTLIGKSVISPDEFNNSAKIYMTDAKKVRLNSSTSVMLKKAASLLSSPNVAGVRGALAEGTLNFANAIGKKEEFEKLFGTEDGARIGDQKEYKDFIARATTAFITEILNEGGKISNQERDLALSITGALKDGFASGLWADKVVLQRRIKAFNSKLQSDTETRLQSMDMMEKNWGNYYADTSADRVSYGERLRRTRGSLGTGPTSSKVKTGLVWKDFSDANEDGTRTYNLGLAKKIVGK